MTRKISLLLVFLMILLTICGCGIIKPEEPTSPPPTETTETEPIILTLNDLGGSEVRGAVKLTNMGLVNGYPNFVKGGILINQLGGKIKLLDLNGNPTAGKDYNQLEHIFGNGICAVSNRDAFGINLIGIVDCFSGEELAPCDAVDMQILSDRFILLSYINEITSEKDYYGTFYRGSYELRYTGYGKIFDLQERQFVPNLELSNSKYRITTFQSAILIETDEYSVKDVYHANGTYLGAYVNLHASAHSGIALQVLSKGIQIYNGNMEKLSFLPGSIYEYDTVPGSSNMLVKTDYTDEGRIVYLMDMNGKRLSVDYRGITAVFGGKYIYHNILTEENQILYGISDFMGKELLPPQYKSIQYIEPGYFLAAVPEGYQLFRLDGTACNQEPLSHHGGSPILYQEDIQKLLIAETGEIYEPEQYPDYQCLSLIFADNKLVDVFTGETVLDDVDDCMSVGNNIYIWDKETECFTRYLVEYKK